MCTKKPVYVVNTQDTTLASLQGGATKSVVVTPKGYWGLPMGARSIVAGLRLTNLANNAGVTLKWQWSLDGVNWNSGSTVIGEQTADGAYTGELSIATELLPYGRFVVEIRDTTSTTQVDGVASVYEYVKYF